MASSNESDYPQLQLAREQGDAVGAAMRFLHQAVSDIPAAAQGEIAAGEYRVAFALTAPEGSYAPATAGGQSNGLNWSAPASDSCSHLRVWIRDGSDGRDVPYLAVRATLTPVDSGKAAPVTAHPLPYGWYPLVNAYGDNVSLLPGRQTYRLRVEIAPLNVRRHDPYNGYRFKDATVAEFDGVTVDADALAQSAPLTDAEATQMATLGKAEGEAYGKTQKEMFETAVSGKAQPVGDYLLVNANEYSEAYWEFHGNRFQYETHFEDSAAANCHVEVAVRDAVTGRFLPVDTVTVTLSRANGQAIGTKDEPFMWHPWLYHYGENWRIPHSGGYHIHVRIQPPAYRRYGRDAGNRFAQPAEADFAPMHLGTGQK